MRVLHNMISATKREADDGFCWNVVKKKKNQLRKRKDYGAAYVHTIVHVTCICCREKFARCRTIVGTKPKKKVRDEFNDDRVYERQRSHVTPAGGTDVRRRHAVPAGRRRPVRSTRGFPRPARAILKLFTTARRPARVYRPPSCRGAPFPSRLL